LKRYLTYEQICNDQSNVSVEFVKVPLKYFSEIEIPILNEKNNSAFAELVHPKEHGN
jgi:hypothetical protein